MTTQELKNKIEKVLGNSIRCLLPSYWWKNLFHSVADRIDEVETTVTENVSDMVVRSLKEFEAKHPDIERSTLYYTTDENSALARSNVTKILRWEHAAGFTTPEVLKPLHIAVPFITIGDEVSAYIIQSPMYALDIFTDSILFADVPFEGKSNIYINVYTGVATLKPASSSGGGSVMFVADPLGDLTEEQKQNNSDAFLKVLEAEGAIDINIMVMFFIAKPNMVSVNDNGDLVLVAAGIDGGASKFIFTPEGDVTVEEVESDTSGGVEIRELRTNSNLSDEDKAYNIETVELYKEGKALVITPIMYSQTSTERTDRMAAPFFVDLHTGDSTKLATFRFLAPQIDETDPFERGLIQEATVVISNDGSVSVTGGSFYDVAMSDTSTKAVQNKVIKKYIDDAIANVGGGGGGNIVVDTEISSTSTNPVQNKVVYSELQKKQGTISDLADIRSGAALGKTALQSEQYKGTITGVSANGTSVATSGVANIPAASTSAYGVTKLSSATNSTSTSLAATASAVKAAYDLANNYKGTVTGVKINGTTKNPSSGIVDLGTVITAHQDISHLATKEELNSLTNEIISNERVHAASLVDIDARIQDILTRLNNAGL